jgi:hypothetical protein
MMDVSMYRPKDTSIGQDGSTIILLDRQDFNHLVERVIKRYEIREWYLDQHWRKVRRNTGLGYYPNGIAIEDTIFLRWKYRGDADLLTHEYGHVLGYGHTEDYTLTIMNPVNPMRVFDPHNLRDKTKANFPDYYRKHVSQTEAYQNTVIGATLLIVLWGLAG